MEFKGIIERVETSEWTTPIVMVKKPDGEVKICADYSTGVNAILLDDKYPLPNIEDSFTKLNGNRVFSQLDLSDAYLQLAISKEHTGITTITTPKGLFKFKRLPFGIKTAPAILQRAMDETLSGLDGILAYFDDILIMGPTMEEHDKALRKALNRLEERGFKLKRAKCKFAMEELKFLGFLINRKGIRADPERTRAISNMPAPTNVSEVHSFLGMINHYGKFIPHLHQLKRPFEELTRKDQDWNWNQQHEPSMSEIKKIMLSPLLLEHYDPTKKLVVAADACQTGIGGVLIQRDLNGYEHAVYHISQSLTETQKNYSQIEKEALALVTAVERFHKFVWGRHFILQTDHKPLVALLQTENTKGLKSTTAARLKRWAIRLLGYDFQIEFVRTEEFGQADALSRLVDQFRRDNTEEIQVAYIEETEQDMVSLRDANMDKFGQNMRKTLIEATERDENLSAVMAAIRNNWSTTSNTETLNHFKARRDSLSVFDGTLLLGDRVIIPGIMREDILNILHRGRSGIRRMKQLAREYVYWPNISKDIETIVRECSPCTLNQKLPMLRSMAEVLVGTQS